MSRDFLSNRSRTGAIIGSGSSQKLRIYSDANATNNTGGINSTLQNKINNLSNEVFLYVDGIPDGKENNTASSITTFGGDVVINGKLYAHTLISTGESSSLWELDANSDLIMSCILDNTNSAFSIEFIDDISYTMSSRPQIAINDTYFEFDTSGNIMPKSS